MFAIALRQVVRHWRTSLGAAIGAAVGVMAVVFMNAVLAGLTSSVISNVIDMNTGAIVIQREGFRTDGIEDLSRDLDVALLPRLRAVQGVRAATARTVFDAVLSDGQASAPVRVVAIMPRSEAEVCPRRTDLELDGPVTTGALIGRELVAQMRLTPGAPLSLFAVQASGRHNALDVPYQGRIDSPISFMNKRLVSVDLAVAQDLLHTQGRATEIALAVTERPEVVAERVRLLLGADFAVETWRQKEPRSERFVGTTELLARVLSIALIVLVLGFVMNATRAAVEERRREIGTMLALGVRRSQILNLFLSEATLIASTAALVGCALGALACAIASRTGLMLRAPAAKPFPVYPHPSVNDFIFAAVITIAGAALAAWFPARAASRLSPNDALRD